MNDRFDVPIAIVVFNRLDCAAKLIDAINKVNPTKLYIISDGPRNNSEREIVDRVRDYIENAVCDGCEIIKVYSDSNLGCDDRSITGYNTVFENEERAILIEDDAIPTEEFFCYCQKMLDLYEDDTRIWMITGENSCPEWKEEKDYYFSAMPPKRAWATWAKAWRNVDIELKSFPQKSIGVLTPKYPICSKIYYYSAYLGAYNGGKAWDVKWDYAMASNGALGIIPSINMVSEIGFNREDATHTQGDHPLAHLKAGSYNRELRMREEVARDYAYDKKYLNERFRGSLGFLLREYALYKLRRLNIGKPLIRRLERKHR